MSGAHELVPCACDPCDREAIGDGYCLPCLDEGCDRPDGPSCRYSTETGDTKDK